MAQAGIFREGERLELLRGDIVKVPPIGDYHRGTVNRLTRVLSAKFGDRACVQVQNPVVVSDDSEPEPDIALLALNEAAWGERALTLRTLSP
ncbi:MAG: Uma2 family endonuclease [Candidatus Eremiobacteraeota bacterium]|nr:Uma2 family endonuclease [Candidatus Eremiobacteraeota bacterium]MBC5803814.1 Uma2 family endonuclease [Candidatus Eremiobacteraeota bacterium]MBC5822404.1 Uma2 family endonuclease [Candidatus Eremiobacteraeota bacterium]